MSELHGAPGTRTIDEIARVPAWAVERTCALDGEVRGVLVRRWAANLRRRFGDDAPARVRARLGALSIDDDPRDDAWVPVAVQLRVTELVVEELLGGDRQALAAVVVDDAVQNASTVSRLALRATGPGALFSRTEMLHGHACTVGRATGEVRGTSARLRYEGSELFEQPTWRLLAMTGAWGLVALASRTLVDLRAREHAQGFEIELAWK